jgi:hypothetical protein
MKDVLEDYLFHIQLLLVGVLWVYMALYVYDEIKPIELTEEWLLKFGFKQTFISKIHLTFDKGSFHLLKRVNHIQIWYENIDVKYVHQLQNLYFALTNQELTIQ